MDSQECLCRNSGTQIIEYYIDPYQRLYSNKACILLGEIPCRTSYIGSAIDSFNKKMLRVGYWDQQKEG